MHEVLLYLSAAAVVAIGSLVLVASIDTEPGPPWVILRKAWARPIPWAAFALVALLTIMAVVQVVHPAVIDDLQRDPHGGWWRSVTALLVQSSGSFQLIFNLAALIVVAHRTGVAIRSPSVAWSARCRCATRCTATARLCAGSRC
jgi:rhomboid protease GluP